MRVFKAPEKYTLDKPSLFLAGSIEMGAAENWQDHIAIALGDTDIILLNPRRDNWDSTWTQSIGNPQFKEQVLWELDAMDAATGIVMYFDPNTKSPISLLELGLHASHNKLIVCCPDGFWRKGNVDIVCERYGITNLASLDELINYIKSLTL